MTLLFCWQMACSNNLPSYEMIENLRVLAIQAEPASWMINEAEPLDVVFSALVVDPLGGELSYSWTFCPVESSSDCRDLEALIQYDTPEDKANLRQLHEVQISGTVKPDSHFLTTAEQGITYTIPNFSLRSVGQSILGAEKTAWLFDYYKRKSLFNAGNGVFLGASLQVSNSQSRTVFAYKRLVLGVADLTKVFGALAQSYGIVLCGNDTQALSTHDPCCLTIPIQKNNENPQLQSLTLSSSKPSSQSNILLDANTLQLLDSNVLTSYNLYPSLTSSSQENYWFFQGDLQTGQIEIVYAKEDPSISWFIDWGSISNALTWPKFTVDLHNVWSLPLSASDQSLAPKTGFFHLWLVLRDERGGISWESYRFAYKP